VLNAFSRKLDECNAFLERYSELKPAGFTISGDTPLKRVRRVWKITCYAFDNASQLKADLSQEMLKLITFVLIFSL
jgi:hypothetical protein